MAVIKKGFLKGASGRMDNVILSSWKGISVIKSLSNTRRSFCTEQQGAQRFRFKRIIEFSKMMKFAIILPVWNPISKGMSGFNLFVKLNKDAFDDEGELCDYSKLIMTKGCLSAPSRLEVKTALDDNSLLLFSWSFSNQIPSFNDDDRLNLVIFEKESNCSSPKIAYELACRRDAELRLVIDSFEDDTTLEIFAFFSDICFSSFSDSVHRELIRTSSDSIPDNHPK